MEKNLMVLPMKYFYLEHKNINDFFFFLKEEEKVWLYILKYMCKKGTINRNYSKQKQNNSDIKF